MARSTACDFPFRFSGTIITVAVAAGGCGGGDDGGSTPPPALVPTTVTTTGSGQTGTVGTPLPTPIGVTVLDQHGDGMAGVVVNFAVAAGGGRTVGVSANTNAQGVATVIWILGTVTGTSNNVVTASMPGYGGPVPTFTASATSGAVTQVIKAAGDGQTGEAAQVLPQPASITAKDALANPVPGATITWSVTAGGGSVASATSVTDATGTSSMPWTLGPLVGLGVHSLRAQAAPFVTATFTASAVLTSGTLGIQAGDNQSGAVNAFVPIQPAVLVTSPGASGVPVAGVTVTWAVTAGGGAAGAGTTLTDGTGMTSTTWTLGGTPGSNNQGLRATVPGLTGSPISFAATATALPTQLTIVSGDGQSGTVGTPLAQPLVVLVRDSTGAPIPNVIVEWAGWNFTTTRTTDAAGQASVSVTLGGTAGSQNAYAHVPSSIDPSYSVQFQISATPGPPTHLELEWGDGQSGTVGAVLPEPIMVEVQDQYGNLIAGATVNWSAATGSVSVASSLTDANGHASASWTIGTVAGTGNQSATGSLPGVFGAQWTFIATARPGPAATMTLVSGDAQGAIIGTKLATPLAVKVEDTYGNSISGLAVTWDPTLGGGWVSTPQSPTTAAGVSTVTRTLGNAVGPQTTNALLFGATPLQVTFNATGDPLVSEYAITLRYLTAMSPLRQAAFDNAAARWSSIIYGDLPNVPVFAAAGTVCGPAYPAINETIDDVLIFATIDSIDGPGGILGAAGPCLRRGGSRWTVVGGMEFDVADVGSMEASGIFEAVILHEMAHVLGFGTWWTVAPSLLAGAVATGGFDPYFIGPLAKDRFAFSGGAFYGGPTVPVEAGGGPGTRDSHWRESVMGRELMTGYISLTANPLSSITVASLGDMAYTVSYAFVDPYNVSGVNVRMPGGGGEIHLVERIPDWTLKEIDAQGRITGVR